MSHIPRSTILNDKNTHPSTFDDMRDVTIREARYSELPRIAQITARAFGPDGLFGDLIHPHSKEYPKDTDLYFLRRARVNYWDYTWIFLVAVIADEQGHDKIVATGQWARMGEGGKKMQCRWLDPRNLLKPFSKAAMSVHALIWPNRACDPAKEDVIERAMPFLDGAWTGERAESWYLELLAVDPDYHGQGIGRELVLWGLKRAEDDGICASVIAAAGKDRFYQKCGFDVMDGRAGMGEGNPLAEVPGGNMHWRMPK